MRAEMVNPALIRAAWQGRVSGCMLGKPVEVLSFREGRAGLESYRARTVAVACSMAPPVASPDRRRHA